MPRTPRRDGSNAACGLPRRSSRSRSTWHATVRPRSRSIVKRRRALPRRRARAGEYASEDLLSCRLRAGRINGRGCYLTRRRPRRWPRCAAARSYEGEASREAENVNATGRVLSGRDSVDEDAPFLRPDLVVESAKERKADQSLDAPAFGKVLDVDTVVILAMPEAREPRDADQVALFATDRRSHHGDLLTVAWTVAYFVEHFWNHDRLRGAGVEHESKLALRFSTRPPDRSAMKIRSRVGSKRVTFMEERTAGSGCGSRRSRRSRPWCSAGRRP